MNRRQFLATTTAGTAVLAALYNQTSIAAPGAAKKVMLKKGDVILFQGDSITDAGRSRKTAAEPNNMGALGRGYPSFIAKGLLDDHKNLELKIFNRGISGNKVPDLEKRWQADALDLKPAVLSILIGVNDIWHKMNGKFDGTPESYRDGFAALLKRTREALPDVVLVVCEPFALRLGAVKDSWFPEFDQRRAFAKEVATGAGAIWVPFQTMFDDAVKGGAKMEELAKDGVHPSPAGHELMARTWREVVGI